MSRKELFTCILLASFTANGHGQLISGIDKTVRIWEEPLPLPTYLVDPPDLNPRFYDGRAYQGAQGRVYPYPIYESLSDTRVMKEYDMVFLENEYIKINILPEIGGRLFGALDKTNDYDYIYRQHVIKPGLIGMLGAWISGGIEWNFPHHHRATAFMPVDYFIQENKDGSATLWIGELEIRHRMKFLLGISVYPGKSYFEVTFRPYNGTPFTHSFLYFANTGVHSSEDYQVIFPPSTEFGVYHGKNQFVRWPISHEEYNSVDYTEGVDISWWKNHPEWTSIFAWNYEDDFVGGYDHGKEAGLICFSNHHIAPGKKFWTWSTGPRGQLWDRALTESDGPELEIMIGGYSDNQPDYSWLQPYESKYLKQYWYPIREIGGVKNANLEAAVNMEFTGKNKVKLGFNTTSSRKNARVVVDIKGVRIYEQQIDIDPSRPFLKEIPVPEDIAERDIRITLFASGGTELISYQPAEKKESPMPEVAKPPKSPGEISTVEELYYTGLRLEQFYNPSFDPVPYYEEALRRDPYDYRVNTAVGLLYIRKGMFDKAERHLKTAVDRITNNYTKPRDGEAYYYLGLCQKFMGNYEEAYNNLYQATWSYAYHSAANYQLAQLGLMKGNYDLAIGNLDRSISTNSSNTKALNLKSAILRKMDKSERAMEISSGTMSYDPLDVWSMYENYLACKALAKNEEAQRTLTTIKSRIRGYIQTYLELSLDYANAGLWDEAIDVLSNPELALNDPDDSYPMRFYYLGYFWLQKGDKGKALDYLNQAVAMPPDFCFPFRLESINILETAIKMNPSDPKALYYLGNLLYELQPEKAVGYWERSRDMDNSFPIVHRNLGMAYYKTYNDLSQAIASYEKAISLSKTDQRLLYEADLLYAAARTNPEKRLKVLSDHHEAIAKNNVADALSREVMLLVQLGLYNEALNIAENNYFRQWEGVSKAYSSYVDAHLLRGLNSFNLGNYESALADWLNALKYPENMMVAESYRGGRESQVYYLIGTAYEKIGKSKKAKEMWELSVSRRQNPQLTEIYFYRALSLKKLGRTSEANEIFDGLIELGKQRLDIPDIDFFAKFGERETVDDRKSEAYYLIGLGYLGKGMDKDAKPEFEEAVRLNINHIWARWYLNQLG
jgi:tetratricopeptide (TPR) repeat protein